MSEHELWNELGNLYFMSGAYNQAVYAYNRSIQLDGQFGRPYSNLALTYVQQGKYQEAIELYRSSIELLADNKEKAISWSRLGNVYRHLKEYKQAVVAYQRADELDPQINADDQLHLAAEDSQHKGTDIPQSGADAPYQRVKVTYRQPIPDTEEIEAPVQPDPAGPEVQLAEDELLISPALESVPASSIDNPSEIPSALEVTSDSSSKLPVPVAIALPAVNDVLPDTDPGREPDFVDDSTASWALADLTRYQQDISESPDTGSLTIWGEPDNSEEDDWDLYPALDPDSDVYQPGADGDELTRWVPIPEEEIRSELEALELFKDLKNEMLEPDVKSVNKNVSETVNYLQDLEQGLPQDTVAITPSVMESDSEQNSTGRSEERTMSLVYPLALPAMSSAQPQAKFNRIELELDDRLSPETPAQTISDFVLVEGPKIPADEIHFEPMQSEPEVQPAARDSQELEEIEAGIAKFKRAVQVNPRNAYAWDALGTLYKSAGLYKDAVQAYQEATSIDPPKALYFQNLGLVYACEGRDDDAIAAFQRVIEIDPDYSLAHATLGGYYRKKGMEELAQKHIGKAMKNIFDSENEYNRACLEAICGNADHAIELLGVALKNRQTYVDWILRDPDLDFIRQDPRFKQLVSDYTR